MRGGGKEDRDTDLEIQPQGEIDRVRERESHGEKQTERLIGGSKEREKNRQAETKRLTVNERGGGESDRESRRV